MNRPLRSRSLKVAIGMLMMLAVAGCGGSDDSTATPGDDGTDTENAIDEEGSSSGSDVPSAPDLAPQAVCDALPVEEMVAVMNGELGTVESLDTPPQCSVNYATSDEARASGAANGTNLLVAVPTSGELEGETGDAGIAIATEFAFFDSDPQPVDVGDGGLSDGKFLYYAVGGRVVGVVAGDDMTAEQLIEVAELTVAPLTP